MVGVVEGLLAVGIVGAAGILSLAGYNAFKIIQPHERGVVERVGRYNRTIPPGLNLVIPEIERVRHVDMREKLLDIPAQEVITKDNVAVGVDAVIYYQVFDPMKVLSTLHLTLKLT